MSVRKLPRELQRKAETELYEVPDRIEEDLRYIRDWLSTRPDLQINADDQLLLGYLRSCKYNYEKTISKLQLLCTQKEQAPEFFGNKDPFCKEIQELMKRGVLIALPKTADRAGPRILLFRASRCDPTKVHMRTVVKVFLMILDILYLEDDNAAVAGIEVVADLKDLSYSYLFQLTPNFLKKAIVCILYAYPTRLRKVCFVNSPSFFTIIYRILKMVLPTKIAKRVNIYNNFDDVCKEIPKEVFPVEYGGNEISSDGLAAKWKHKMERHKKWFLNHKCDNNEVNWGEQLF